MHAGKILISINSSWNFVNFRAGLVRALAAAGYEIVAAAPDDGHLDQLEALGCRPVALPMLGRDTSPVADAALFARYLTILRRERPDAYLGYTVKPNVYGSLAAHALGIPVINNIAGLGTAFLAGGWLNRTVRALYKAALRGSQVIFFQNPDDRDLFVRDRLVPAAAARLLPGSGVDLARFSPAPGSAANASFLLVARLLWAKGVGEYVEAGRLVRRNHPEATCRILGILDDSNGAVDRASVARWHAQGDIDYLGSASDVRPPLSEAACVVLPSYYPEGTPRSLLEAAAMGKPIITTDLPGCRQVVDHGVNGYLCPPRDAQALAEAMERFLQLTPAERQKMGEASRAKAEREFDERIVIEAYLSALREVIGSC